MAFKNKWHVILGNTEGSNLINASFSKHSGIIALTILGLFFLMVAGSAVFIIRWHIHFPQIEQVMAENRILKSELNRLMTEVDSISFRLKQMQEWEDELRIERNIGRVNRDVRQMGTGGLPSIEVNYSELDRDINLRLNLLWMNIHDLNNVSKFAHQVRSDLIESATLQEKMYLYTPSIYPAFGRISSPYGWRRHPVTGRRDFHRGLDISNSTNTAVYVTANGTVRAVGYNRYYGRYIIVTHKFGYETMYAHLNRTLVKEGDSITRGDIIGQMGSTGRSTGSHLHYEVRKYRKTVNPYPYLNKMENDIAIASK